MNTLPQQLRIASNNAGMSSIMEQAAVEIERLTAEVAALKEQLAAREAMKPICYIDISDLVIRNGNLSLKDSFAERVYGLKSTISDVALYVHDHPDEQMTARCAVLADRLSWILPLAKGYAVLNRVGSNQAYCDAAEEALSEPSASVEKLLAIKRAAEECERNENFIESTREAGWIIPNAYEDLFSAVRANREKE